jgi:hypothetical protein
MPDESSNFAAAPPPPRRSPPPVIGYRTPGAAGARAGPSFGDIMHGIAAAAASLMVALFILGVVLLLILNRWQIGWALTPILFFCFAGAGSIAWVLARIAIEFFQGRGEER